LRTFYKRPFQRRSFRRDFKPKKYYFLNFRIEAPNLRVIDDQGKQVGVLAKTEALRIAQEKELDLVLIAPRANPPVAKIIDFKKFLYQEQKKEKEAKKGIKKSTTKDVNFNLFIGEADFERLVKKGEEFIKDGNQLRINLTLRGREVMKRSMAFDLVKKYITHLGEVNVAKEPKIDGRVIRAVVSKKK